jgi:hypothetical protein
MKTQYLFFGQFLRKEGLISEEDIFQARNLQKSHNRRIGEIAMEKGWLASEQIDRVLVIQEDTKKKFGEVAISNGYLSSEQVKHLLMKLDDSYLFFGEALVRLGVLSNETLVQKLKEFNTVFGNGASPPRPIPPQKAELSKKRLNIKDCKLMQTCDFFNDKMKDLPGDAHIMRVRYCMGASARCARHMVHEAAGNEKVPDDLFPDQVERARMLIVQLAV